MGDMRRKYDDEFKRDAVNKVFLGQAVRSVSRELGVSESLLHKWKRKILDEGDGRRSGVELSENLELRKKVRELEQENEILKKATLIFGKGK